MDPESGGRSRDSLWKVHKAKATLLLAYQSLGVVYGDLSISPIFVFTSTFSGRLHLHEEEEEIFGVLSLIFWTLTIIPVCKYIVLVLGADDNGEGGTFALYSLLCRHSKLGLLSTSDSAHDHISNCSTGSSLKDTRSSRCLKEFFEKSYGSRIVLFLIVILGTSMVIGDGVLTPSMSVLSAVYGMRIKVPHLHENYTILIASVILLGLFALQHYGTHRVGFLFAPILVVWLLCISGVGIYNIRHWNPRVVTALSPYYVFNFFRKAGKDGWSSLGGVVLCVTGAEAMFADLGHFSHLSIRIAFAGFVYPCLILAYMGEAAYLSKNKEDLERSFYRAIPERIFWPVFIIATLATVVGSQAIISATFSIISQCRALRCFPRVKIVHTSSQIHGQIYIPEINWILMVLCLAVVIGFRDTRMIGNAYGLAVIIVMFVTTCLMFLIIVMVWNRSVILAAIFVIFFGSLELLYVSACLSKVHKGGWLPLILSMIILLVMSVWHYGTSKKQDFERQNKVRMDNFLALGPNLGIVRVPGIGLIYSNVVSGLPPMFERFVTNFPAFHCVAIFVTVQYLMVPKVPGSERFLVSRIGPPYFHLFRCLVRYGYKDMRDDNYDFEVQLIRKVEEFLLNGSDEGECRLLGVEMEPIRKPSSPVVDALAVGPENVGVAGRRKKVSFSNVGLCEELRELAEARESGVAYMVGNTTVVANESSSFVKKLMIGIVYGFLRRNCRRPAVALGIPPTSLIEVGMVYTV
ncbi:probable potassium transporter 13 [Macadamia integrifolia]|uniref:probable potassium transporter 13 n=1 Tax=Macadamia integrifolia TaxID=60698 RepID=UPI001C533B76|nr:probable potassium transporter 13 [Macadamia integrifolia]